MTDYALIAMMILPILACIILKVLVLVFLVVIQLSYRQKMQKNGIVRPKSVTGAWIPVVAR